MHCLRHLVCMLHIQSLPSRRLPRRPFRGLRPPSPENRGRARKRSPPATNWCPMRTTGQNHHQSALPRWLAMAMSKNQTNHPCSINKPSTHPRAPSNGMTVVSLDHKLSHLSCRHTPHYPGRRIASHTFAGCCHSPRRQPVPTPVSPARPRAFLRTSARLPTRSTAMSRAYPSYDVWATNKNHFPPNALARAWVSPLLEISIPSARLHFAMGAGGPCSCPWSLQQWLWNPSSLTAPTQHQHHHQDLTTSGTSKAVCPQQTLGVGSLLTWHCSLNETCPCPSTGTTSRLGLINGLPKTMSAPSLRSPV